MYIITNRDPFFYFLGIMNVVMPKTPLKPTRKRGKSPFITLITERMTTLLSTTFGIESGGINTIHYNGRYKLVKVRLNEEVDRCGSCGRDRHFVFNTVTSELDRWCSTVTRDGIRYTADIDTDDLLVYEVGPMCMKKKRVVTEVKESEEYDNPMIEAAHVGGFLMAKIIFKLQESSVPLNVFDGTNWWVFEESKHRWCLDKMGMKFHLLVIETVNRAYTTLKSNIENEMVKAMIDDFVLFCFFWGVRTAADAGPTPECLWFCQKMFESLTYLSEGS